jgi:thiol-disulfide isomerase/thioredoxin
MARLIPLSRRQLLGQAACVLAAPARAAPAAWDFTLPTLEGDRFVQLSQLRGPVLVNFWGRDCPPCVAELPRLQAFAKSQPSWTLLLVATDTPQRARQCLLQRGISGLTVLRTTGNPAALMRGAGNRSGALPFSVALQDGRICQARTGEWTDADLLALLADLPKT